jgi:molecular chaperone DnaK
METLATESQAMGSAIYAQTSATQDAGAGAGAAGGEQQQANATPDAEDVVDAEIVDEDKK